MAPLPGLNEFIFLLFVILCIFGTGKLPAIATSLGKTIWRLRRRATSGAPAPSAGGAGAAVPSAGHALEEDEDEEDEDDEEPEREGPDE